MRPGIAKLLVTACLVAFPAACDRKPPAGAPTEPAPDRGEASPSALGFVEWLERDGQFAVLYEFDEDTDGDGRVSVTFGDHGEPTGDEPSVVTVTFPEGAKRRWDELVATDGHGRWVVLRRGDELVALSSRREWRIEGADLRGDHSPCLPARQASIDASGRWLTYLRSDPARAVVKDLETGEEREHSAEAELWRADATPRGWVALREIPADTDGDGRVSWPRRRGSCVCSWCERFATSLGRGRFVGDAWRTVLVSPDGERHDGFTSPIPLADDAIWSMDEDRLYSADREPREIRGGVRCEPSVVGLGDDRLVVRCGTKQFVWSASTDEFVALSMTIDAIERYVAPFDGYVPVRVRDDGGPHVARLNLADGVVETGPEAIAIGPLHPSGWLLSRDAERIYAFDVKTGSSTTIPVRASELGALTFRVGAAWFTVDPSNGKTKKFSERPEFVASNGCAIWPQARRRPVRGPFRWVCP